MFVTQDSALEWLQKEMAVLRAENAQLKKDFETLKKIVDCRPDDTRVLSHDAVEDASPATSGVVCAGPPLKGKPFAYFPPSDKLREEFGFSALRVVNSIADMFENAGYRVKTTNSLSTRGVVPGDIFVIFHHRKAHDSLFRAVNPFIGMKCPVPIPDPSFFKVELVDRKIMSIQQTPREDEVFVHIDRSEDSDKFMAPVYEVDEKTNEAEEKIRAFLKKN